MVEKEWHVCMVSLAARVRAWIAQTTLECEKKVLHTKSDGVRSKRKRLTAQSECAAGHPRGLSATMPLTLGDAENPSLILSSRLIFQFPVIE